MAELTKEWLKQTIAEYEANRDELPFGLDTNSAIELQAFKLALASLEAEQVAYIFKHPAGKLFWALTDESNKDQSDVIPVYAAPPVPVVPAALPENDDEDGHDIDYLEPSEVYALGRTAGWNACRAAMLQGKSEQPQNAQQNIPENIPGGNSPAIPDDWVMVPKEPTQAMIKAWLSEVANWRGHVAGYKAALAAAPQHEVK
ncbi:hypothetical protein CB435_21840 [Salmonella enterica subsp. enterica serovar Schwarzengrund]|nr:hypothetical protein [Salmonella enterica]EBB5077691.1 hypothetical protein [Salmonella enterica subsp. enterica serovar Typhimurium]EEJ0202285.1 hypothetical protein [Salmonella enterica subsp. enterica]EEM6522745.1 hypothetical protein [Salmonella enterica subsp. enterica serovar Heidelberg]ECB3134911.1 hypothetical protein [Salmonella enterica subsp. enterica serovar Schwarzengrund]ECD1455559.1 hypothetical protein [Salmonella enterica subsp. enterica serovar Schwarzengrund]